jgi:membrane-associated phospholipid phosphatase
MAFDQPIHDFVLQNKDVGIFDEVADFGNIFGEVTGAAPLIAGTLAIGLVFDNNEAKEAAFSTMGALALTQLVVETMKYSINRSRPEKEQGPFDFNGFGGPGAGRASFPSGHSAAAWTIATVFAQEYGDKYKWAPAVAYSIAAMTSYARLNKDKHWASDVLLGAMIGYVSGNIMHRVFKKFWKSKVNNIHITPMIGKMTGFRVEITEKVYADLKHWPLDTFYNYQLNVLKLLNRDTEELKTLYKNIYL